MTQQKVNSKLFFGNIPSELREETYYAYIDVIDSNYCRFDCVVKKIADELNISNETILTLPSIIFEVNLNTILFNKFFASENLETLESEWVVIKISKDTEEFNLIQFFNFVQVGEQSNNYGIESLTLFEDLEEASQTKIKDLKKATTIEQSSKEEVEDFIKEIENRIKTQSHVNVYNVGQGNCNAVVCEKNIPRLYYDVGGGFGPNKNTYPVEFRLCHTHKPPVILSHWDLDHIQIAIYDPKILESKWLVPSHLTISVTAMKVALELITNKRLICWNDNLAAGKFNNNLIIKCTGNPNIKNDSGLTLLISNDGNEFIMLPGDASFEKIPYDPNIKYIGLVASHHGAKSSVKNVPHAASSGIIAYSFGDKNTYNHPFSEAITEYTKKGWKNSRYTTNGNIGMISNLKIFNTPCPYSCALRLMQVY